MATKTLVYRHESGTKRCVKAEKDYTEAVKSARANVPDLADASCILFAVDLTTDNFWTGSPDADGLVFVAPDAWKALLSCKLLSQEDKSVHVVSEKPTSWQPGLKTIEPFVFDNTILGTSTRPIRGSITLVFDDHHAVVAHFCHRSPLGGLRQARSLFSCLKGIPDNQILFSTRTPYGGRALVTPVDWHASMRRLPAGGLVDVSVIEAQPSKDADCPPPYSTLEPLLPQHRSYMWSFLGPLCRFFCGGPKTHLGDVRGRNMRDYLVTYYFKGKWAYVRASGDYKTALALARQTFTDVGGVSEDLIELSVVRDQSMGFCSVAPEAWSQLFPSYPYKKYAVVRISVTPSDSTSVVSTIPPTLPCTAEAEFKFESLEKTGVVVLFFRNCRVCVATPDDYEDALAKARAILRMLDDTAHLSTIDAARLRFRTRAYMCDDDDAKSRANVARSYGKSSKAYGRHCQDDCIVDISPSAWPLFAKMWRGYPSVEIVVRHRESPVPSSVAPAQETLPLYKA